MPFGMFWVKCKQSNSHTSLTTLCSHFLLSNGNQAMTKSAHWWSWSCDLHWWSRGSSFSHKYLFQKASQRPTEFILSHKQVSGRNSDQEWLRMINAFILCDLLWKVQESHAANRERSFNIVLLNTYMYNCVVIDNIITLIFITNTGINRE